MTRKLISINMSNWSDEAYVIDGEIVMPGEYIITNHGNAVVATPVLKGEPNGYEPPAFPIDLIDLHQECP